MTAGQQNGDLLDAHRLLLEASEPDVRPLLARLQAKLGGEADPVAACRAQGHAGRLALDLGSAPVESAYERI
ncbi:MAG: hypothetical protein ABR569_06280 [Gaiellaceae bacterium]